MITAVWSVSVKWLAVKIDIKMILEDSVGWRVKLQPDTKPQGHYCTLTQLPVGGTAAAAPRPFRPSDPALCGSHPLVTPYYCRLGDLLCFVFIVWLLYVWFVCVLYVPSVPWYCWLGLLTCKNRLPYNLYCVGGDVKHCSVASNQCQYRWRQELVFYLHITVIKYNLDNLTYLEHYHHVVVIKLPNSTKTW